MQAIHELRTNMLRSFLSLLGITIGIFCIMSIKSAVDSLESNIRKSFEKLGNDVLYISKMPFNEDPSENYWKYMRRPNPGYFDFISIKNRVPQAEYVAYSVFLGRNDARYMSNTAEGMYAVAITEDYDRLFNINLKEGRFYSTMEYQTGAMVVVIGHQVADLLFGELDPIGKHVKIMGHHLTVIGVIEPSGKDLVKVMDFDKAVLISYPLARKIAYIRTGGDYGGGMVAVKAAETHSIEAVKDEVIGAMRASRRLNPQQDNNFSINELSMLSKLLDEVFKVINLAGMAIGIFALLVGMFSVANIMFVSVRERTAQIGIKKALGARSAFVLFEFLTEAMVLSLIGGLAGLLLVFFVINVIAVAAEFPMYLSLFNVALGIFVSAGVGLIAGLLPALQAARMDPVEAMRS